MTTVGAETTFSDADQNFHAQVTEHGYAQPDASLYEPWFAGKDFTTNWVIWKLGMWQTLAARIKKKHPKILEVGSWEGRSAITWLNLIPGSHITCIDHWNRIPNHERRFTSNLAEYGARVRKIAAPSRDGLETLLAERRSYDLIYIDGDHTRDATLRDSTLAWPMLRRGGVFLWDDYLWETHLPLNERPAEAIDWFIEDRKNEIEIVHRGFQVAGIKLVRPLLIDASPARALWAKLRKSVHA
jgi:predicted O-methyltransferase YrrM